jgi:hypothetical protein
MATVSYLEGENAYSGMLQITIPKKINSFPICWYRMRKHKKYRKE